MRSMIHEERILQDPVTAGLAVIAVVGTGASIDANKRSARRQADAQRAQQKIADEQTARQRRQQVREARIKRALIQQQAVNVGAEGSSSIVGAEGNVSAQAASNLSFLDRTQALAQQASIFNQQAADAGSDASMFGAVASLSTTAASGGFGNPFASSPTPPQVVSQKPPGG